MNLSKETINNLIDRAIKAREKAYIPYSSYQVGAAVLTDDDHIITGANVKGGSFNLICCNIKYLHYIRYNSPNIHRILNLSKKTKNFSILIFAFLQ
jgi:cytidine deaminase